MTKPSRKLALVTAGNSAIGRHLVLGLAGAGYDVAFTHLNAAADAAKVVAEVAALGGRALAWDSDAGDEAQVLTFHEAASGWTGVAPAPTVPPLMITGPQEIPPTVAGA